MVQHLREKKSHRAGVVADERKVRFDQLENLRPFVHRRRFFGEVDEVRLEQAVEDRDEQLDSAPNARSHDSKRRIDRKDSSCYEGRRSMAHEHRPSFARDFPRAPALDTLVSACPWSERPLTEQGEQQGVEVFDIFELTAESAGFEV